MECKKVANYRPITLSAIAVSIGIVLAGLTVKVGIAYFLLLAILAVAVVVVTILKRKALILIALFTTLGFLSFSITYFVRSEDAVYYDSAYLEGRVEQISSKAEGRKRYVLEDIKLNGVEVGGKAQLTINDDLKVGDVVGALVYGSTNEYNPFDTYVALQYGKNIRHVFNATYAEKLYSTELDLIEKIRVKITDMLFEYVGEEEGAVALGLVLGDTAYVNRFAKEDMRVSGLAHLFAVSGLHIGFMCGLVYGLFRLIKVSKRKSLVLVIAVLLFYGIITAFPAGVVRATIMALCLLFSEIIEERYDALNTLSLAVILMLLFNPSELFNISFLMSVGAVFGIACFYRPLSNLCTCENKIVKKGWDLISVSVAANSYIFAISAYAFGTVSIYFVLSNLVAVPVAGVIYSVLVSVVLVTLIIPTLGILLVPLKYPIGILTAFSGLIASLPSASVEITIPIVAGITYAIALTFISKFNLMNNKIKIIVFCSLLVLTALIIIIF